MGCCGSIENVVAPISNSRMGTGHPVDHILMNLPVKLHYRQSAMGREVRQWSNSEEYQPDLANFYSNGYRMLEFLQIPGQVKLGGFRTIKCEYQAIFYNDPAECENYTFKIIQSTLSFKNQYSGMLARSMQASGDMSEMFRVISEEAAKGSRYLGMAQMGMDIKIEGMVSPVIHGGVLVDLMFEVPQQVNETYTYNIVSEPISMVNKVGCCGVKQTCDGEFSGIVQTYLSQGWRLITTFIDFTGASYQQRMLSVDIQMNCLWIFEKPASKANSNSPMYEGKIVEFTYKVKAGCCGTKPMTLWNATVEEMGKRGWHVAAIVPTPESSQGCSGTQTTRILLIFQRLCEQQ